MDIKHTRLSDRLPVERDLDQAVDSYWRNRVYHQTQIWLVPTTSDHLHFTVPAGQGTYL